MIFKEYKMINFCQNSKNNFIILPMDGGLLYALIQEIELEQIMK